MSGVGSARIRATLHLKEAASVGFEATELWPRHGAYSRFGNDLPSFAQEVMRRLQDDGFVGFARDENTITVIPLAAVRRLDFTATWQP
jgi:hypothetical protein